MADIETAATSGAVSSVFAVNETPDGVSAFEIHWTAYTSEAECAAGETVIIVAKDPGNPPVIKATIPEVHHLGYASTPTITASVSGDDVQFSANGLAGKDIQWSMRIES